MCLGHSNGSGSLGFCVVYAPNLSLECGWQRDWMVSSLPIVDWIVGGDFNMVKWGG